MNLFQISKKVFSRCMVIKLTLLLILSLTGVSCVDNSDIHPYPLANDSIHQNDSNSLRFFVLSDWGYSGSTDQRSVAAQMSQISKLVGIRFILTCGDNFQVAGVESVNDPLWNANYETVYNDSALQIPWYPALGNHDYYGKPEAQVEYSQTSKYWKMPARHYSFVEKIDNKNSVRFIVLDTQGLINDYQSLEDTTKYESLIEYVWLKNLLSVSKEKWTIVTSHHPVFSASTGHGDTYEMKMLIKPLFDQYKVDFYICGHDHNFEHARDKEEYTDYIVTGTGGSVRPAGSNNRTIYSMSTLGFSYFSLTGSTLKLYFITSDGRIGYSFKKINKWLIG